MSVLIFHECFESLGDGIDRSALGADKGGHTDGEVMSLPDGRPVQPCHHVSRCERVSGADRVSNLDFRGRQM